MKIKRWTVYDGVAKKYYSKRFFSRRKAQTVCNNLILNYNLSNYRMFSLEEEQSIIVVELY